MLRVMAVLLIGLSLTGCAVSRTTGTTYSDQPTAKVLTKNETTQVIVDATADPWRNSGVYVVAGNKYRISAEGTWRVHYMCKYTNADGEGAYGGFCQDRGNMYPRLLSGVSQSALVAKIGEAGKPFVTGNQIEFIAEENGPLLFHINEPSHVTHDNAGQMTVATALLKVTNVPPASLVAASSVPAKRAAATPTLRNDPIDTPKIYSGKSNLNAYAIVIGIENYRQKLPKADFAANDASVVSDYLVKTLGFLEENVVTLTNENALKSDMEKYYEKWLLNNVEPGDTVFIYYSGHGAPNPKNGDAYLVPYDGDPAFINETGYSLKRLYASLGKLPAKEIVVALDSCFSGVGNRSVLAKGMRSITISLKDQAPLAKNIKVLAASSGEQASSTYDEKGHGLFTYFLLKGIKDEGLVASNRTLKLEDLFSYIKPQVERVARKQFNNEQTPQLIVPN